MSESIPHPVPEGLVLLDELNHRIKNELASVINFISFRAIWTDNIAAKEELSAVVDLLHHHVHLHNILAIPDGDVLVDAGEQLRKLGLAMCRSTLDRMNIHLVLAADPLPLEAQRCWHLALMVHELVTNAVRHACFDGRRGEIKVKLMRAGSWVDCRVSDNGTGLGTIKPGKGLRMVSELAKNLGARIDHTFGTTFTSFVLDFPLTPREQRANNVLAARRPRPRRRRKQGLSQSPAAITAERSRAVASPVAV